MNSLEQKIDSYQPTELVVKLVNNTKIILLVGISGAGKDTIKKELLRKSDYRDIISHTTRSPRANNGVMEIQDIDYHFIDAAQAETMVTAHDFIEVKFVHGTVYGTSAGELQKSHDDHKIAVTDIDVQGVAEYKQVAQSVVALFILPPSYATWRQRLSSRYGTVDEFEAEWPKRRDSAINELTHALAVPYYHFIINDTLGRAVRVVDEIAHTADIFRRKDDEARLSARDLLAEIIANP